jgi:putative heme-binding domain-containing protein
MRSGVVGQAALEELAIFATLRSTLRKLFPALRSLPLCAPLMEDNYASRFLNAVCVLSSSVPLHRLSALSVSAMKPRPQPSDAPAEFPFSTNDATSPGLCDETAFSALRCPRTRMRYTFAMRRCLAGFLACLSISAQTPRSLYQAHCAGCHGPAGEGSRGPALRVAALQRANDVDSLVALLRRGVPGTEMPATAPQVIADEPLRALAGYVLSLRPSPGNTAATRDARGVDLFRGKGKCLDCHRVNGEGSASGPDLTDIGRQRDPLWLRRALVEPESAMFESFANYRWTIQIPDNYLMVELTTAAGERVTGSRMNEDAFSIQVRDTAGRIRSFLKSEVTGLRKHWDKSPMPSYKNIFSDEELVAIVAYLSNLRGLR